MGLERTAMTDAIRNEIVLWVCPACGKEHKTRPFLKCCGSSWEGDGYHEPTGHVQVRYVRELEGPLYFDDDELLAMWQRVSGGSSATDPGASALRKLLAEYERRGLR
jgi:hypothetical protein